MLWQNYQKELTYATKWLHKPEKLSGNTLVDVPSVKNRYSCRKLDCLHEIPGECLSNTIRYFVERQIKKTDDYNAIWKGCILLWLSRVYPGIVGEDDRIPLAAIYDGAHSTAVTETSRMRMEYAVDLLQDEFLSASLASLFVGWPPSRTAIRSNITTAKKWLLDQLLKPAETLSFQMLQQLAACYSRYPLFALETQLSGLFNNLTVTPLLRSPEQSTTQNINQILDSLHGKIYIYGPPGSGKTVLSRYVVWRLATRHLNNNPTSANQTAEDVLPLPFDVRRLDTFAAHPAHAEQLQSLAVEQLTASANPDDADIEPAEAHWMNILETPDISTCPVVDNWDSLRLEPDLRPWRRFIERELHRFSTYIIFSRSPDPGWKQTMPAPRFMRSGR